MNYKYIEAPTNIQASEIKDWRRTLFLAGSISGAWDWQKIAAAKLINHFHVFNPRRANFNTNDKSVEREQITWEYLNLQRCCIILFYFSFETLAPITLFEYGAAIEESKTFSWKKYYICVHDDYPRKNDIYIQTELRKPTFCHNMFNDLDQMLDKIIEDHK